VVEVSFHHNNERPAWYFNIKANNEREAFAMAFREAAKDELCIEKTPPLEDFMPINDNELHTVPHPEGGFIVMWNHATDKNGFKNMGFGYGDEPTVESTSKWENCWLKLEKRKIDKKILAKAVKGYQWQFEKLPTKALADFLHSLDRLEE
jgi:hypothetical protein